uniref:Transcriptional regulator n=1 Tax=Schistosoma mansoni TaxID=6183 RepID=A0A5K4F9M2_SCHMA
MQITAAQQLLHNETFLMYLLDGVSHIQAKSLIIYTMKNVSPLLCKMINHTQMCFIVHTSPAR